MPKYSVIVDVDRNGGDDDVFVARFVVEAETAEDAMALADKKAFAVYGESNVLGAWDARLEGEHHDTAA